MANEKKENEHWKVLVLLLKEIAIDKKISQNQIALETGLIQSNVSRFFSLKYKPNLDVFLKIAQCVGVNFFFEDKESKSDLNVLFEKAMASIYRRDNNSISPN